MYLTYFNDHLKKFVFLSNISRATRKILDFSGLITANYSSEFLLFIVCLKKKNFPSNRLIIIIIIGVFKSMFVSRNLSRI